MPVLPTNDLDDDQVFSSAGLEVADFLAVGCSIDNHDNDTIFYI